MPDEPIRKSEIPNSQISDSQIPGRPTADEYPTVRDPMTLAALRLHLTAGVGPTTVNALRAEFGAISQLSQASVRRLAQIHGIGRQLAERIVAASTPGATVDVSARAELDRCATLGIEVRSRDSEHYPDVLQQIWDPPTVLYLRGRLEPVDGVAVAIVGTRQPTRYGIRQAERLAASLCRAGVTIVSGLARGVDAAAHRAAIAAGGRTLAVMAGGLETIYPAEHRELAASVAANGAVLSEMPLSTKPRRGSFPRRNRVIAGLSLGVVVIEASMRSGALITARHAAEQGREVFALPGPVDSPQSRGCHQLLRDGATLVESAADILEGLGPLATPVVDAQGLEVHVPSELQLNDQERQVLQAIEGTSTSVDEIVVRSQLPVHRILATLSVLEMRHLVRRLSGDRVSRS